MIINPGKEVGHQEGEVQCSESLGGILRYYHRAARELRLGDLRRPLSAPLPRAIAAGKVCSWATRTPDLADRSPFGSNPLPHSDVIRGSVGL